jgi:hypothetical protein
MLRTATVLTSTPWQQVWLLTRAHCSKQPCLSAPDNHLQTGAAVLRQNAPRTQLDTRRRRSLLYGRHPQDTPTGAAAQPKLPRLGSALAHRSLTRLAVTSPAHAPEGIFPDHRKKAQRLPWYRPAENTAASLGLPCMACMVQALSGSPGALASPGSDGRASPRNMGRFIAPAALVISVRYTQQDPE